jgi:hypothetical protein
MSKRTIITLSEKDKLWLESYGKVFKISVAEAIRQGISRLLTKCNKYVKYDYHILHGGW